MSVDHPTTSLHRFRLEIQGVVQGVGFRPFAYQLATQCNLAGWIENTPQGTTIEIEGHLANLETFQHRLHSQAPPSAKIETVVSTSIALQKKEGFSIQTSLSNGPTLSVIPPDLAICKDCLLEITDPSSRRYRYPFTTCTQCGPRYSIVEEIPYDRSNTTMKRFLLCEPCQIEYEDMTDRRFHAETIACPNCGPHLELWDDEGTVVAKTEEALLQTCSMVREGKILAVKGLGGFQFLCDAQNEMVVQQLRNRKHRPRKPFAVLFPSMEVLRQHCECSTQEENILTSPESPIVILLRKEDSALASAVAPDNPYIGAMLPYTPLHHLLMAELHIPVVATSGNRSEEPIVIDEREALTRLSEISDAYLVHDRPIIQPVDDSVVRVVNGEIMMLRRARGYAPVPMTIKTLGSNGTTLPPILAVGGHLKNTVAVTTKDQIVVSQHIGDLSTPEAYAQFERTVSDQMKLFDVIPQAITCDLHPDYRSTIFAKKLGKEMNIPVIPVQHHYAHILSCMAEHGLEGPVLGVAWDGAGYGSDGTIWGGEFLLADYSGFKRVGHLKPFRLPGGEICMREPRRVALSLLYETFGEECLKMDLPPIHSLGPDLSQSLVELLKKDVNCPITTSMGRLFDGISSILGLCHLNTFEGEAAMALEFAAEKSYCDAQDTSYSMPVTTLTPEGRPSGAPSLLHQSGYEGREHPGEGVGKGEGFSSGTDQIIADWQTLVRSVVRETWEGKTANEIGLKFHHALTGLIVNTAEKLQAQQIVLSGGVFQNSLLQMQMNLQAEIHQLNFFTHRIIPSNDGGLSLGQTIGIATTHEMAHTSFK